MITFFVQSPGLYVAYGLSTDTKPATPPDDCLFIEIDTGKQFRVVASAWVSLLEPTALGAASSYVILSVGTLTNSVHDQLVTGNVGHVGTETDTFTFVSGADIAGSAVLGTTNTPLSPVGDAHILYQNLYASIPTFAYAAGAVDLATDVNSPDGVGVFKTGVYKITGACNVGAAGITLTGLGTFIFIVTGALSTTTASIITLANGATADNVFFVSNGIVTLAAGTTFAGTILSGANAITTGAGFNLNGRLISESTITLGGGANTYTIPSFTPAGGTAWGDITGTLADQTDLQDEFDTKQDTLVSGTNIKTINGSSVLGPGDLVVSGAASPYNAFTKDLGAARRSGTFDITGLSGLTADKVVSIVQTAAQIASKGNARDEPEMDLIRATGYVVNATTIRAYWQASGVVVGTYAFAYQVSG